MDDRARLKRPFHKIRKSGYSKAMAATKIQRAVRKRRAPAASLLTQPVLTDGTVYLNTECVVKEIIMGNSVPGSDD